MGIFGKKSSASIAWMAAVQEAKAHNSAIKRLNNIFLDNRDSGAHMVWQHLRDQSGDKMKTETRKKSHHDDYVQRALKKAALNENYNPKENSFISTKSRDQVLLMYRAAQKNKTKAGKMLTGKGRKDNLNYYPGMLKEDCSIDDCGENANDIWVEDNDDENNLETSETSSSAAYHKIHVQPLPKSSRNVSRNSHSWQPLSMTALQEYSPQITVNSKSITAEEKMWNVL